MGIRGQDKSRSRPIIHKYATRGRQAKIPLQPYMVASMARLYQAMTVRPSSVANSTVTSVVAASGAATSRPAPDVAVSLTKPGPQMVLTWRAASLYVDEIFCERSEVAVWKMAMV